MSFRIREKLPKISLKIKFDIKKYDYWEGIVIREIQEVVLVAVLTFSEDMIHFFCFFPVLGVKLGAGSVFLKTVNAGS